MNLLDRYLQAVRFFLPRRQQDDIVRELSENLLSQMEDRAEELGRPLSEDEQADILRRHGHPMLVAGRYRSHQQLIGPTFFPIYVVALQAGLAVALLVTIVVTTITSIVHGDPIRQLVAGFLAFPARALMVFAWTTLGFAALDFAQSRLKLAHRWDPRSLPKVVKPANLMSRGRSLCEFLLSSASAVWLMLAPWAPYPCVWTSRGLPRARADLAPRLCANPPADGRGRHAQLHQLRASVLDASAVADARRHPRRHASHQCQPAPCWRVGRGHRRWEAAERRVS